MKKKTYIRKFCIICFLLSFLLIFFLTKQSPKDTLGLTDMAINILPKFLIEPMLPLGELTIPPRRMAHIYEFFFLGIFVSAYMITYDNKKLWHRNIIAIGICLMCSLFDQTHKLFVLGREFDYNDLIFDFIGYSFSIIIINLVYCIVRYFKIKSIKSKKHKNDISI